MLPPLADQVTAVLLEPLTVDVNCCVPLVTTEAEVGEMLTATTGALTVTVAEADLVLSAALVAVTVKVPALLGAVYSPLEEMLPPVADQVTAVLLEPLTVAVNCCVPFVRIEAETGEMATVTPAVTVIATDADTVLSAVLVAFTV